MATIIESLRELQNSKRRSANAEYVSLIGKLASGGESTPADTEELARLTGVLGWSIADVEADFEISRKLIGLRQIASELPARQGASAEARRAVANHQAAVDEITKKHAELQAAADRAGERVREADAAAKQVSVIEASRTNIRKPSAKREELPVGS